MSEKVYSPTEAAKICDVHYTTIHNWIREGNLKAHQTPGGHHKIIESDLIKFLKKYKHPIPESVRSTALRKILIAEDDPATRRLMVRLVRQHIPDCDIYEALTGYEAGFKTRDLRPDLVILDLMLPCIDGIGVCRMIRKDPNVKATKILAVTAYRIEKSKGAILRAGANKFLSKPFSIEGFIRTVGELIS